MIAAALKLVPDSVDQQIDEIDGEMLAANLELVRSKKGTVEVLPPDGFQRYDDLANARAFLRDIGEQAVYCPEAGKKWFVWKHTHWEMDHEDFIFEYAEDFAERAYGEARRIENEAARTAAKANAVRINNAKGFNSFLGFAQRKKTVKISSFDDKDATGHLLNCKNGTLNLRTGALKPHDRADNITRVVRTNYLPGAVSPVFERFLERILPDPDIRAFLQRSIGYSLLGTVPERSFWILYGTGNNGKSILTNLFINLLGNYASTTPASSIMAVQQSSSIPNDIARLKGKRFIVVPETNENERVNAALLKSLSAGDKVSARHLFAEWFDFYFTGKLWIATNHKPRITDHSKGFWDRVKLIPFVQDITDAEVIKSDDLMRQLMAEAEGILAWAVQGSLDYFEMGGLDAPKVIQAEIDAYRFEQDSIAQFIQYCLETVDSFKLARPDEYVIVSNFEADNGKTFETYKKYCNQTGEFCYHQRLLTQKLRERGFTQYPDGGRRKWTGFRIRYDLDL